MAQEQHICSGCVPIDAKIIEVYTRMISAESDAEAAAERAEHAAEAAIGKSPYIGENGDWWEWNDERGVFIDTGVRAQGSIAVDIAMSSTSTNPVQNKVITGALNEKYTKPATGIPASDLASGVIPDVSGFYTKPANGIPADDIAAGVIPDVSQFITASVNNLVNYYLKSETYNKSEVQEMIGAIQGFSYEVVASLPTASASTKGKIYLVPSSDPQTQNVKDEFITIDNGASSNPRYTWEQIGSTAIDLSGYVTTTQLNTALAAYTTTANLTTLLAAKQDVIADLSTIRSGAAAGATAYQKPGTGIPSTDMASVVQTSLGKADTAYQKPSGGIPASDLASGVIPDVSGFYTKPASGIPASDIASGVIPTVPAISTDVSADAASDAKTSSPKSVKTYVDAGIAGVESDLSDLEDVVGAIDIGAYVMAWDGNSEPVVANIPAGVSVTYNTTTYTGTLAASASTIQKIYLVATGTTDNYDRYITVGDSTYSWVNLGTTEITLADYATKAELSQLEAKVDDLEVDTSEDSDLDIIDENAYSIARFQGGHIKTKNFDSSEMSLQTEDASDLDIVDSDMYSIVRFENGHIKTKKFNSEKVETDFVQKDLDIFFNAASEKQHYDTVSSTTKNLSFPYDLKKNICFALKGEFSSFATITIGKGYNAYSGYWFVIDSTSISLYANQGTTTLVKSVNHGLAFTDFVKIVISNIGDDYCRFFIQTRGGQFAYNFGWTFAANGQTFFTTAGTLTDVDFIASCSDLKNDVWLFGDSYVGMANPARWPKQLRTMGYSDFLCDGLAGQSSSGAYSDLQRCLALGVKPQFLIWTLGMNDTDSAWNTTYQQVKTLCESNDITLILATVPTVPSRNKENINTTVRNSGYDYIDFANAVGANSSGVWYSGYLSSDAVHPTELGAKALATQFIFDFILKH